MYYKERTFEAVVNQEVGLLIFHIINPIAKMRSGKLTLGQK